MTLKRCDICQEQINTEDYDLVPCYVCEAMTCPGCLTYNDDTCRDCDPVQLAEAAEDHALDCKIEQIREDRENNT